MLLTFSGNESLIPCKPISIITIVVRVLEGIHCTQLSLSVHRCVIYHEPTIGNGQYRVLHTEDVPKCYIYLSTIQRPHTTDDPLFAKDLS